MSTIRIGRCRRAVVRPLLPALVCLLVGCGESDVDTWSAQLSDRSSDKRREAANELGRLGPDAEPAVPLLREHLDDEVAAVRQAVTRALGDIGIRDEETLAGLKERLDDDELSVRLGAAFALLELDAEGQAYIPVLNRVMTSGEGGTIVAVGNIGPTAGWALPTLVKLLRDRRPGIRRLAAEAIGKIGPDESARAALEKATRDQDDRVRASATRALSDESNP